MSKSEFNRSVDLLIKEKRVFKRKDRLSRKNNLFVIYESKQTTSHIYTDQAQKALSWIDIFPFVRYMGISGSLSMKNTSSSGDIDLFVITSKNTVWITRFVLLLYKKIFSLLNPEIGQKFCFNLFFSEKGLQIPPKKHTEYSGHELLQLKHIVSKNQTYELLLTQNSWIKQIFPNMSLPGKQLSTYKEPIILSKILTYIDKLFRRIQILWLQRNKIKYKESKGQLWLIQEDFETKLRKF